LTNQKIIEAVQRWQARSDVHSLTCGNNNLHRNLVAEERGGRVVLVCLDCNYVQKWIPVSVLYNREEFKKMKEKLRRVLAEEKTRPLREVLAEIWPEKYGADLNVEESPDREGDD